MTPSWTTWRRAAQLIHVAGRSVALYDLGPADGAPVTYLHGYPSASIDVAGVAGRLVPDHRILTLDLPGFGASDKTPGHRHSIHAAADAVEHLWRERQVRQTVLVAHDYGVSVAQELLARRVEGTLPVTVTGMVWMNGGLYPDLHRPTLGQQLLLDPAEGAGLAAAMTREMFVEGLRGTWGQRAPLDEGAVGAIWDSMDDGGGVRQMHELLHYIADRREHELRWRAALEGSDLPTAFVWGDLDPVSGAPMIARVEERIPSARVVRMPDVGHWPPLEAPHEVAAEIRVLTGREQGPAAYL